MKFYSQCGEDKIIWPLFKEKGFFVDIGAMDGIKFSNTYAFERAGWQGICVEPNPNALKRCRKNRKCTVLGYAVSDKPAENQLFYATKRGQLSSLDKELESLWRYNERRYSGRWKFKGWKPVSVAVRTLTEILDTEGRTPDLLSIDTEGNDLNVLKGLDFAKYKPRVIIIEYLNKGYRRAIRHYLNGRGYYVRKINNINQIACINRDDYRIVRHMDKKIKKKAQA